MGQNRSDEATRCQTQPWNGWTGQQSGRKTKGKLVHQYAGWTCLRWQGGGGGAVSFVNPLPAEEKLTGNQ